MKQKIIVHYAGDRPDPEKFNITGSIVVGDERIEIDGVEIVEMKKVEKLP